MRTLDIETMSVADGTVAIEEFAAIERLASAGKLLVTRCAEITAEQLARETGGVLRAGALHRRRCARGR